ncbi:MAG TPA: bifunctional 5,10-methylenetetrahydrofolate dehydrogenase/5,10-methenyltetrahydrofolate cyclohydrolase [Gaiellaceae bacterium]
MAATMMLGKPLAERIRAQVAEEVSAFGEIGLATVLVGDDPASHVYVNSKHKAATEAGFRARDLRLPDDVSEDELLAHVEELNDDDEVDAILVQLPLPDGIDEARIIRAIDAHKDVDGFHPFNAGQLYLGRPTLVPATPLGIMALLAEYRIPVDGARAVVIGRSDIVGKPIAHLLMQANATVSICHSHTDDLSRYTLDADILVVAAGKPAMVGPDMVKAGSCVVDVGINRTDAGLVGDVDPGAAEVAAFMTPVPGGVGPMTIALLLRNAVRCARYRTGELLFPSV